MAYTIIILTLISGDVTWPPPPPHASSPPLQPPSTPLSLLFKLTRSPSRPTSFLSTPSSQVLKSERTSFLFSLIFYVHYSFHFNCCLFLKPSLLTPSASPPLTPCPQIPPPPSSTTAPASARCNHTPHPLMLQFNHQSSLSVPFFAFDALPGPERRRGSVMHASGFS